MDITEVVRRSGLPASTLRYYEHRGLIASVGRRGLHRVFAPSVLERLSLIALGQASGFSLDEIASMFSSKGEPEIDRQLLLDKADAIDRSIKNLTAMRNGLRHAAVCPAPDHLRCPKFRRLMGLAATTVKVRQGKKRPAKML